MKTYKPNFKITNKIIKLCMMISNKLGKLEYVHDLSKYPILRKTNRFKSISSSLNIENISVSYDDVESIVEDKPTHKNNNFKKEAKNTFLAYEMLDNVNPYSMEDLLKTHKTMMNGLIKQAGQIRNCQVYVVSSGNEIIHIAPRSSDVPPLMKKLFDWLRNDETDTIIKSCVFHYQFEYIHPFRDGNGRMGRLWQTAILSQVNPLFKWLPIESVIFNHQSEYYQQINVADMTNDCTNFIEFMLRVINISLDKLITDTQNEGFYVTKEVKKLLTVMDSTPRSTKELMKMVKIKSRSSFYWHYLRPAVEKNLIKMLDEAKPKSKNQKYYK